MKTIKINFILNVIRKALVRFHIRRLEERHRKGYEAHPAGRDEFSVWENEQVWGN